jgi:phytoene/squalene synthetase
VNFDAFNGDAKTAIEQDIQHDFDAAYEGIIRLPQGAKWGVYLAYMYYVSLFNKIKSLPASRVLEERIRVPDNKKIAILIQTYFRHKLNYM